VRVVQIVKVTLVLVIIAMLASPGFSQDALLPKQKAAKTHSAPVRKAVAALEVLGKVDAITLADPAKGIRSQITVIDEGGNSFTLLVKPTTTIYGPDWKAVTLDKLSRDQMVRVQYIKNKEGFLIAQSIKPVVNQ